MHNPPSLSQLARYTANRSSRSICEPWQIFAPNNSKHDDTGHSNLPPREHPPDRQVGEHSPIGPCVDYPQRPVRIWGAVVGVSLPRPAKGCQGGQGDSTARVVDF